MRKSIFFTFSAILLGMLCIPLAANAIDLSTLGDETVGDSYQGRIARYMTFIGGTGMGPSGIRNKKNLTPPYAGMNQGLYDYASYSRYNRYIERMNDGNTTNYFNDYDDGLYDDAYGPSGNSPTDEYPNSFYGYKFKMGASLQSLALIDRTYVDGGTFLTTPEIQVMSSAGIWSTATVTWDTPYLNAFDSTYHTYNITFSDPSQVVYGVRVIGEADPSGGVSDDTGFAGVAELVVDGTPVLPKPLDLTTNLALNQTPIWTTTGTGYGLQHAVDPIRLVDGNTRVYSTTWNEYDGTTGFTADEEFAGVLFDESQTNVGAVGMVMMMFRDGGYITADTLDVEYLEQGGDWSNPNAWHSVSNLDLGSYGDNYNTLNAIAPDRWQSAYAHSELLTFDTIIGAIDGIRIIGDVPENSGDDTDGFLGMTEFEVFAAAAEDYIPGDANKDGFVDGSDATILANYWQYGVGMTNPDATWAMGDFNDDHIVDGSDATLLASHWQEGTPPPSAAVPEPSTILLLLAACLALLPRWIRC